MRERDLLRSVNPLARLVRLVLALALLVPLAAACGPAPTATELPPGPTVGPSDTPAAASSPQPAATETPQPTVPAEPTAAPMADFSRAECSFELPAGLVEGDTIECGTLEVPEDRADPNSAVIRLAVAILRHPGGDPEPDPIFYLEGGPGGSALEFLYLTFGQQFEPLLAANRDIVVFDQRGVGVSEPALDCPKVQDLGEELLDWEVDGKQVTETEATDLIVEATLACGQDLGRVANLAAYNTAANAADVNDLRRALGYEQVNLWGISYGTRLALEVMRDHPDGIRSVVLDSVYPPDVDLYAEVLPNLSRSLDVLFEGCASSPACNAAYPELRTVFFETMEALNESPASFQSANPFTGGSYDVVLTGDDLGLVIAQTLYLTEVIPSLPQIIYEASQAEFGLVARLLGVFVSQAEAVSSGMQFSVQCHDEMPFSSPEKVQAEIAAHPELAGLVENSSSGPASFRICQDWGAGKAGASANEAVSSDLPTLLMAGEYDPITPPAWTQHAAETLETGHAFEYRGVGHGASLVDGCPREMMMAFIEDPSAVPDDACRAEMGVEFAVPAEGGATVEMVPFTNASMGIQGQVPAGWTEVSPGVHARGSSAMDTAVVIAQGAPTSAEALLDLMVGQLGLAETPTSTGERKVAANGITWTLYSVEVQGMSVDFALAESGGLGLIVALQSESKEHDTLYETVFLPTVDSVTPIE